MRVSLKTTYAIHAALDLALSSGEEPIRAKAIARRQGIPARFLEQVLNGMKKAGLVQSLRGAQGGYTLNKPPADISLAAIVEALDGPLSGTSGGGSRSPRSRNGAKPDTLSEIWDRVRQAELDVLNSVSLKDLAARHRQLQAERGLMYHI
jgi:Rrf2 family protein